MNPREVIQNLPFIVFLVVLFFVAARVLLWVLSLKPELRLKPGLWLKPKTVRILPRTYEAIPVLLSAAERSFFGVLQQALGSEYQIFVKVRLADILRPVHELVGSPRQTAFNQICAKHIDFVVCERKTLQVIGVLELDDKSHTRSERQVRDNFVDSALREAGIPVLRVSAKAGYSPAEIRQQVLSLVRPTTVPIPQVV